MGLNSWKCPSKSRKPKQDTGCPNGMDCTYLHEHGIMGCVDENYDSTEDIKEHVIPLWSGELFEVNHAFNKKFASV